MTTAPAFVLLTISQLAARTGVAASALRYYEALGLIGAIRTPAGHRRYPRPTTRRVAFIVFAQKLGLTLEEVGTTLASLPARRAPSQADWERLSSDWVARVDERIAHLERLRRGLADCIGCGCLSLERCHILNPGDRLGQDGAGPRLWLEDGLRGAGSRNPESGGLSPDSI